MIETGAEQLRKVINVVLDALVQAAEQAAGGRPLPTPLLVEIVAGLKQSKAFDDFYQRSYSDLVAQATNAEFDSRRTNAFGRLILRPLDPLFEAGRLDRALIPNLFNFLHMALGEEADAHAIRCRDLLAALREEKGIAFSWEAFYSDPEIKEIFWRVLLRIAESFRRFDLRRDWFIKLMQHRQNTVSLASNAFYAIDHDPAAEPIAFEEDQFALLFHAWFDPLEDLTPPEALAFRRSLGKGPQELIGPFLTRLAACRVPVASAGSGC